MERIKKMENHWFSLKMLEQKVKSKEKKADFLNCFNTSFRLLLNNFEDKTERNSLTLIRHNMYTVEYIHIYISKCVQ